MKSGLPFCTVDLDRAHCSCLIKSIAQQPARHKRVARQSVTIRIVEIHHGGSGRGTSVLGLEEPLFSGEILFHGVVEVEVVHAQVGKHSGSERGTPQAFGCQPLGRYFHHHGLIPGQSAFGQHLLQIKRLRSRPHR